MQTSSAYAACLNTLTWISPLIHVRLNRKARHNGEPFCIYILYLYLFYTEGIRLCEFPGPFCIADDVIADEAAVCVLQAEF